MFSDYKSWSECQSCLDLQRTVSKSTPDNFQHIAVVLSMMAFAQRIKEHPQMCPNDGCFLFFPAEWITLCDVLACMYITVKKALKKCSALRGCLRTKTSPLLDKQLSEHGTKVDIHNSDSTAESSATLSRCTGPPGQLAYNLTACAASCRVAHVRGPLLKRMISKEQEQTILK